MGQRTAPVSVASVGTTSGTTGSDDHELRLRYSRLVILVSGIRIRRRPSGRTIAPSRHMTSALRKRRWGRVTEAAQRRATKRYELIDRNHATVTGNFQI